MAGLAGCDAPPEMISEREEFRLRVPDVSAPRDGFGLGWERPYRVLAGARLCPELACGACPDEQTCNDAAIAVSGAIAPDGEGCFVAEAAGEAVWTVGPECGEPGLPPDRVVMQVVAPEAAGARTEHEYAPGPLWEAFALHPAGAAWPAEVAWPLKIVAESQVAADVQLVELASGGGVAHDGEEAVRWTTTRGRPPIAYPDRSIDVVAFVGTEATASLAIGEHTWPIGQIVGVPGEAATSLEIAASIYRDEDGLEIPVFARAVARDRDGALLAGLPVRWSIEGGELGLVESGRETVAIGDCRPPEERGGAREAVLRARYGSLSTSLTLRWQGLAEEADPDWSRPSWCLEPAGCDCRQSGGAGGLALLVLTTLAVARRRRRLGALALAAALPGCAEESPVLHVRDSLALGELPVDWTYHTVEGGQSAQVGDRSLWVFHQSGVPSGPSSASATLADADASDGLYPFEANVDAEGDLRALIRLTDEEAAFNADNSVPCTDGCAYVSMWTGPIVHDPEGGRALIFYNKRILRENQPEPTFFEQLFGQRKPSSNEYVGTGLAVWRDDEVRAERPEPGVWSDEPTLMFRGPEPRVGAAAVIDGEFLYGYACDGEGHPCVVARAPLAEALQREAWRFFAGSGEWSGEHARAEELFEGAPVMSVHHSELAGAFVAVYARSAGIVVRTAPRPEGPWSDAEEIHRPFIAVPGATIRGAALHPELSRADGTIDYVTYFDGGSESLQLVEIVWDTPR